MEQHTPPQNTNILLWCISGFFNGISELTAESAYTWTFRILSLISVILIIIINYPKAKETLKNRKDGNN